MSPLHGGNGGTVQDLTTRPHVCPWPGCREVVPRTQLFCRPHWYRLPKPERDDLTHSYRNKDAYPRRHRNAVVACVKAARALATPGTSSNG